MRWAQLSRRSPASADPLSIRLVRGAVVSGRVVDPLGYPVVDANVTLRRDSIAPMPSRRISGQTLTIRGIPDPGASCRVGTKSRSTSPRPWGITAKVLKFSTRDGANQDVSFELNGSIELHGPDASESKRGMFSVRTLTSAARGLEVPAAAVEVPAGEEL